MCVCVCIFTSIPSCVCVCVHSFSLLCMPVGEVGNLLNMFVVRLPAEVDCSCCYCTVMLFVSQTILQHFADSLANATLVQGLSISDCPFFPSCVAAPYSLAAASSCRTLEEHAKAKRTFFVKLPCSLCASWLRFVLDFLFSTDILLH